MKNLILEGVTLAKQYGYWSEEVYNFNNRILGTISNINYEKLQNKMRAV